MIVAQTQAPHRLIAESRTQLIEKVGPAGVVTLLLIPKMQLRVAQGDEVLDAQSDLHDGAGQLRALQFFAQQCKEPQRIALRVGGAQRQHGVGMVVVAEGHIERLQCGIPPAQIALQFVQDAPQGKEQAFYRFYRFGKIKTAVVGLRGAIGLARIRPFTEQALQVVRQLHAPAPCQCVARQSKQLSAVITPLACKPRDGCRKYGKCAKRQRCDRLRADAQVAGRAALAFAGQGAPRLPGSAPCLSAAVSPSALGPP